MLFNSYQFVVFLLLVFVGARLLDPWRRARHGLLLVASYLFYAGWNPWYLWLMFASTVLDYAVGLGLGRVDGPRGRKALLLASLAGNLGLLGFFKYGNFLASNLEGALAAAGVDVQIGRVPGVLPVGISFYTFQTLSYTIDVYRRRIAPVGSFLDFSLFVAFFPQLVAGPILRAREFIPQLDSRPRLDRRAIGEGLFIILVGLFKKMVLSDGLSHLVVSGFFQDPAGGNAWETLLCLWAAYLGLYCDFSGYSDVAIGAALLFGFHIPRNFERPATALSPLDHWRAWHVSLQNWLRDYLFIPLGGSRGTRLRTELNIVVTFGVGGIWHGAAWCFLLTGLWNGVLGVLWRRAFPAAPSTGVGKALAAFATFNIVAIGMVFMRDYPVGQAFSALARLVTGWADPATGRIPALALAAMAVAYLGQWLPERWYAAARDWFADAPAFVVATAVVWAGGALFLFADLSSAFFYFQF